MPAPIRRRTRARELALQFLYTLEMRGVEAEDDLGPFLEHHTRRNPDKKGAKEVKEYASQLVLGVRENLHDLNLWIERIASNWRLDRMAYVDRNVLRLAIYELLHKNEVPFKVVINEAIDLAKRFSTSQSGGFVNGILDRSRVLIQDQRDNGIMIPEAPAAPLELEFTDQAILETRTAVPTPRPTYGKAAEKYDAAKAMSEPPRLENGPIEYRDDFEQPEMPDDLYGELDQPAATTEGEENLDDQQAAPVEPDDLYQEETPLEPDNLDREVD